MPKVRPLIRQSTGNEYAERAAEKAKKAGRQAVSDTKDFYCKVNALQKLAGFKTREELSEALGFEPRRIRYLTHHLDSIRLSEAVAIQTLANRYALPVFDEIGGGGGS